jgi:hypothetical protein
VRRDVKALALALLACACGNAETLVLPPSAAELRDLPMRVEAGVMGWGVRRGWSLHLEPDGRAAVFLQAGGPRAPSEIGTFELDLEQRERLREVVLEQRFFELPPVLGRGASDHATTWIEVHFGPHVRRVELQFISLDEVRQGSNGVLGTLAEVQRARAVLDALTEPFPADWNATGTHAGD